MYIFTFHIKFYFSGEGSFSTVYLGESRAEKSAWVAIKVVEKCNLLKTKKIPNPLETTPDQEEDMDIILSMSMMEQKDRQVAYVQLCTST